MGYEQKSAKIFDSYLRTGEKNDLGLCRESFC